MFNTNTISCNDILGDHPDVSWSVNALNNGSYVMLIDEVDLDIKGAYLSL